VISGSGRPEPIEAVIFDLDGVLIDSEEVWERARRSFVVEHGGTYTERTTRDVMGMSAPEWAHYLRVSLGVALDEERINREVAGLVIAAYQERLPLFPGAVEAVRRLAARFALGLASSSNRSIIDLVVREAGLDDAFAVVVSSEEAGAGKPAPDVYLRAAALLGIAPARCAAVEDSTNGLRSAKRAGMRVIALPNRDYPPAPEALALADAVLPRIAALEVATVIGLAPSQGP
jgi:HAD superfamily hydrolase (TIGR01509 family)